MFKTQTKVKAIKINWPDNSKIKICYRYLDKNNKALKEEFNNVFFEDMVQAQLWFNLQKKFLKETMYDFYLEYTMMVSDNIHQNIEKSMHTYLH